MRLFKLLPAAFLSLLMFAPVLYVTALAAPGDDDDQDEYDVNARVIRVNLLKGDVQLRRAGSDDWEAATINTPLVEGDTLATGRDAEL